MRRHEVIVTLPKDVGGGEDFAEVLIVSDVAKISVFDEVDEAGKVVKEGGKMVFDVVPMKESVILHGVN